MLLLVFYVVCMPCSHCCHATHCTYGCGDTMLVQGTLPSFLFTLYSHIIFSIRVTDTHRHTIYMCMHTHFYSRLALIRICHAYGSSFVCHFTDSKTQSSPNFAGGPAPIEVGANLTGTKHPSLCVRVCVRVCVCALLVTVLCMLPVDTGRAVSAVEDAWQQIREAPLTEPHPRRYSVHRRLCPSLSG